MKGQGHVGFFACMILRLPADASTCISTTSKPYWIWRSYSRVKVTYRFLCFVFALRLHAMHQPWQL